MYENNLVHSTDTKSVDWNIKRIIESLHEVISPCFNFPKTLHVVVSIQLPKAKHTVGYAQLMIDSVINNDEIQTVIAKLVLNLSLSLILSGQLNNCHSFCPLASNYIRKIYPEEKLCEVSAETVIFKSTCMESRLLHNSLT